MGPFLFHQCIRTWIVSDFHEDARPRQRCIDPTVNFQSAATLYQAACAYSPSRDLVCTAKSEETLWYQTEGRLIIDCFDVPILQVRQVHPRESNQEAP